MVEVTDANMLEAGNFVHQLAGRKKIQELQETLSNREYGYGIDKTHEEVKNSIIAIGLENGLVSKYTSFVGIHSESRKRLQEKPMMTREIKNQVPSGYGGFGKQHDGKPI